MRKNAHFVTERVILEYRASVLRKRLYEDVVKRLIKHEAKPCALLGLETTSEYNRFRNAREYASGGSRILERVVP